MKNLSIEEIKAMPATDLVDGLRKRRFSLLQSLGFRKLKAEMNFTGFVCWAIIALTGLRKEAKPEQFKMNIKSKGRQRVIDILGRAAPCYVKNIFPHPDSGMVIGFNHPSLGEILRFIYICADNYEDRVNLFPVNLPWYEAIMPIADDLEKIGIYIMPVLTPSTKRKMAKKADEETMKVVESLSTALTALYQQKCVEFVKNKDAVWVAPTATRQKTIFKTKDCYFGKEGIEPQTMTFLAFALQRSKVEKCQFLAVGVVPPEDFGRGLNLFRSYKLDVGKAVTMETARKETRTRMTDCPGSLFEFNYLLRITNCVIDIDKNAKIIYPTEDEE